MVSLRTRRFREAEHRAGIAEVAFKHARDRAVSETDDISQIKRICREYIEQALAKDTRDRLTALPGQPVYPSGWDGQQEPHHHDLQMTIDGRAEAEETLFDRDYDAVAWKVTDLMARYGVPEELRRLLSLGIMQADLEVYDTIEARVTGKARDLTSAPRVTSAPVVEAPPPAPTKPNASELVDPFFRQREDIDKVSHKDMAKERRHIERFIEACGDRPVNGYNRGDVTAWLFVLRRLPALNGKSQKAQSLGEMITEADRTGAQRLKEKSVKNNLSSLSQFFRFAVDAGHLSHSARVELVEGHRFREDDASGRDGWTAEELVALFATPVWRGSDPGMRSRPGTEMPRDAKFWLPLLGLFHGCRLEEFADLYGRDIRCMGGVWFVRLTDEVRSLKTDASIRDVPLHPEVIRMGFLDYIRTTALTPDDPLFPDLQPQGKDRRRGPRVTRWFANYRQTTNTFRSGVAMHAFRHTANTRLRNAAKDYQHRRFINYMFGWGAGAGATEGETTYDGGPDDLRAMAETLALLRYPELDLSHLYVPGAEERAVAAAILNEAPATSARTSREPGTGAVVS